MTTPTPKKKAGGRKVGATALTTSQKAEAVALWRAGDVTLDFLAKKFGKRRETFSRLFKRMGITKGSSAAAAEAKVTAAIEARALTNAEETMQRIAAAKEQHFKMADGISKLLWGELVRARQADLKIENLKETFLTLKIATEVLSNARKEIYTVLNVEEVEARKELEDLPDLVIRELTGDETKQLQQQQADDEMGITAGDGDPDLLPDEFDDAELT